MAGMDTSAMRGQLQAAALYVEGDEPNELQRVDVLGAAVGDPVPFNPDHRTQELEHTEAGSWVRESMLISTRAALVVNASYTWNGSTWTVQETGVHHAGAAPGVWHYSLSQVVT